METNKPPELVITYEPNGVPTLAICSLCGEPMTEEMPRFTHAHDTITAFACQFHVHVKKKHPLAPSV
jgi:hypothetical protein